MWLGRAWPAEQGPGSCGFSRGPENPEQGRRPLLAPPGTHWDLSSRAAAERGAKDTFWKPNSMRSWQRAASCRGRCSECARVPAAGAGAGRGGGVRGGREGDAGGSRHRAARGEPVRPSVRGAQTNARRGAVPPVNGAPAKHACAPESQGSALNNSERLLNLKPLPMILPSEVNSLKSLPSAGARPASRKPSPRPARERPVTLMAVKKGRAGHRGRRSERPFVSNGARMQNGARVTVETGELET